MSGGYYGLPLRGKARFAIRVRNLPGGRMNGDYRSWLDVPELAYPIDDGTARAPRPAPTIDGEGRSRACSKERTCSRSRRRKRTWEAWR